MSLMPCNVDFQETWANLKETITALLALRPVQRRVWIKRHFDVYALCVAYPRSFAGRLYEETRDFLDEHVAGLLQRVKGNLVLPVAPLNSSDYSDDGLLNRYVTVWQEYSRGVTQVNFLYSYFNLEHVKRHQRAAAEMNGLVAYLELGAQRLEVGELGLVNWERVIVRPLAAALSSRVVAALNAAREITFDPVAADELHAAVWSTVRVQAHRVTSSLSLYHQLVLEPFLEAAEVIHSGRASALLAEGDMSHFMKHVLEGLEREVAVARRFLHSSSAEAVRSCYEQAYVVAHRPALHAIVESVMREAAAEDAGAGDTSRRADLHRLYALLRSLGSASLSMLVDATQAQATQDGLAQLDAQQASRDAPAHFVHTILALRTKYNALFADVTDGEPAFAGALDKAWCAVVNRCRDGDTCARAPGLVARYYDALLRSRATDTDDKLAAAFVVLKYVDDKDVFQKHYARALSRRLIQQRSASMEKEKAMISRLEADCGCDFFRKLNRMVMDVAVSADLNVKFQQHLREGGAGEGEAGAVLFSVQVLQTGAWPQSGETAALAPLLQLERPMQLYDKFYNATFSGRRLTWLHDLFTGELRTRYTARMVHVTAATHQCALLLLFEGADRVSAREARDALQLQVDSWVRHLRPLLDVGLLRGHGLRLDTATDAPITDDDADAGELELNLQFTCKCTKLRLKCAAAPGGGAGGSVGGGRAAGESESTHCDNERKMYLQAALIRIMKTKKVLRHKELVQEVITQASCFFKPRVAIIKQCIEVLIDKKYLERAQGTVDTYAYLP